MKIRTKIMGGFLAVALVGVVVGVISFITTRTLSGIATEMYTLQVEGSAISEVLNAHYLWRQNLTEAVMNGTEFTGSLDPSTCALGKWSDSPAAHSMTDQEFLRLLDGLNLPHDTIHAEAQHVVDLIAGGNAEEARLYLNETILPTTQQVISVITEMQGRYTVLIEEKDAQTNSIEGTVAIVNISLIVLSLAAGMFFAVKIAGTVSRPLAPLTAFMSKAGETGDLEFSPQDEEIIRTLSQRKDELGLVIQGAASFTTRVKDVGHLLERIANGDLTAELPLLSDQDTMGRSLQNMTKNLNEMFENIHASAEQVSDGAKQVADGSQSLAQGSTEQASAIQALSTSVSEIAAKTKANAALAGEAAELARTIHANAERGTTQMNEMTTSVREINDASHNIRKVMGVIEQIAFQTNILALNASVEAARAGQHGRGFAVVAEEVRSLAAKSDEAAKETGGLIQDSMEKAEHGARIAGETAESLADIVAGIEQSSRIIGEIASSSEEQAAGITQVNIGIDQVAQVVQQNSATAQESAAASEEMSGQSTMLQDLISQFRIKHEGMAPGGMPPKKQLSSAGRARGLPSSGGTGKY